MVKKTIMVPILVWKTLPGSTMKTAAKPLISQRICTDSAVSATRRNNRSFATGDSLPVHRLIKVFS